MRTIQNRRLAMRPTEADLSNLDAIAAMLRANGTPYTTRSDALRFALATIAATMTAKTPSKDGPR